MSNLIDIVRVATVTQVVEAQKRIPTQLEPLRRRYTFYGKRDVWIYHFVADTRLCTVCAGFAADEMFSGQELRVKFPYHKVKDLEVIEVNVHPNCRCYLTRLFILPPRN